jgi:hypothetical protein
MPFNHQLVDVREEMSKEREMAVKAMQALGWTASRAKPSKTFIWQFTRPDTGGLHDVVKQRQDQLSMSWVASVATRYDDAPDLLEELGEVTQRWLRARFFGIYSKTGDGS